jgi:hypothetical protein
VTDRIRALRAALDPECGRYVVVDTMGSGILFEVDRPDGILEKGKAILADIIAVNEWPENGWLLSVEVRSEIADILPWVGDCPLSPRLRRERDRGSGPTPRGADPSPRTCAGRGTG